MSATEAERHQLYESIKSKLGEAEATTFMNMHTPVDLSGLVTRDDLRAGMAELRVEMAELRAEMAAMRSDLLRTLGTWLFASQAGVVAAVALVISLLG